MDLCRRAKLKTANRVCRNKFGYLCVDCQVDTWTIHEYYVVTDSIWETAGMGRKRGMLCIGCLEKRLGRKLNQSDFKARAKINWESHRGIKLIRRSARLQNRLDTIDLREHL